MTARDDTDHALAELELALQHERTEVDALLTDANAKLTAALTEVDRLLEQLHPVERIALTDFAVQSSGLYLTGGRLVGHSPEKTIYYLPENTSKKVAPVYSGSGTKPTNQLKLMRAGNGQPVELGNFTLQGTKQPTPYYGGLGLGAGTGHYVHDMWADSIPGNDSGPPGETFSAALLRCISARLERLKLTGGGVAATLLGYNYTTGDHTDLDSVYDGAVFGFALAMFQCAGTYKFTGCSYVNSRKAVNIEQSLQADYLFDRCDFRGTKAPYVAQVSAIGTGATPWLTFKDPIVDSWPLKVRTYPGKTNTMRDTDIRLYLEGKDVSADPTKLQVVHTG
jgi:hypothetical protein